MGIRDEVMDAWDNTLSPLFDEFAAEVSVEVLDKDATVTDDLYDEETDGKVYKEPVVIKGRVKIGKDRLVLPGGESVDIDGRVTFKTEDLDAGAVDMDFGVRITFKGIPYIVIHIQETSEVGEEFLLTRVFLREE